MRALIKLYQGRSGYLNGNAGDEVTYHILRHFLNTEVRVMEDPYEADFYGAGSIIEHLERSRGVIWGSGLMYEQSRADLNNCDVIALRGPLTARRCRFSQEITYGIPYGDPGLLVSDIWAAEPKKRWELGIVVHYADYDNKLVTTFARRIENLGKVTVIDPCGNVADVCRIISSCKYVISSSLHGLIFADSYGVPNGRIILSDKVAGGSFKFRDYFETMMVGSDLPNIEFDYGDTLESVVGRVERRYMKDQPAIVSTVKLGLLNVLREWHADKPVAR